WPGETGEQGPVVRSRLDENAMRLRKQDLAESDDFGDATRPRKNPGVGRDPNEPAQHLRRDAVARIAVDHAIQPPSAKFVVAGIRSKGVNENVDIGEDHRPSIRSSRSADRLRSMPGSVPPDALEIGNRTGVRFAGRASASTALRPSSI